MVLIYLLRKGESHHEKYEKHKKHVLINGLVILWLDTILLFACSAFEVMMS
jgi:hypothetical protein